MITKAIVIGPVDGSDNYKWWINIPLLQGVPDSENESKLFKRYYEQVELKEKDPEKYKQLLQNQQQQQDAIVDKSTYEEALKFIIKADVCGLAGSRVSYMPGDVVIVGFLDNEMSSPIIIGSYLTKELKDRITYPELKAQTLLVNQSVSLPTSTSFKTGDGELTLAQLIETVRYINNIATK